MTPKWLWTLRGERYPICALQLRSTLQGVMCLIHVPLGLPKSQMSVHCSMASFSSYLNFETSEPKTLNTMGCKVCHIHMYPTTMASSWELWIILGRALNDPKMNLNTTSQVTPICYASGPQVPNFSPFCSTANLFQVTGYFEKWPQMVKGTPCMIEVQAPPPPQISLLCSTIECFPDNKKVLGLLIRSRAYGTILLDHCTIHHFFLVGTSVLFS